MIRFNNRNFRTLLISISVLIALWILFAPLKLGGQVSYVIITGNSMEPVTDLGDLVVARAAADYEVGQRIVYRHPQVGFVFHRIVEKDQGIYTCKGDNNDWLDSFQPEAEDVLGRFWFQIPGGGSAITKLREPGVFAFFSFVIILLLISLTLYDRKEGQARKSREKRLDMDNQTLHAQTENRQDLLLVFGVIALASLIFGVISFTKPVTKNVADNITYQHQVDFEYSATDRTGIYDQIKIATGEPIYMRLTCALDIAFGYGFSAERLKPNQVSDFQGSYSITAVLSDVDGWKRSIPLVEKTDFSGTSFETVMKLDVCDLRAMILEKEEKTEAKNRWYNLAVHTVISTEGEIENFPVQETFIPEINFQIDTSIMRLPEGLEGLVLEQEGMIESSIQVPNSILIFGEELRVDQARGISLIVFGLALLGAVYPAWTLMRDIRKSDVSRIQVQYHPLLVDVKAGSLADQSQQIVEVASFSDLTKMAERYGAMILHERLGTYHRYSVQDEQVIYQYTMEVFKKGSLFPEMSIFKSDLIKAIREDQLEVYYQPVIELADMQLVGLEAFLRWKHPVHGDLYPADFISHAEESKMISRIDHWVAGRVARQILEWETNQIKVVPVSINLSPETFLKKGFSKDLSRILNVKDFDPGLIQIEINRSNLVFQDRGVRGVLEELRSLGVMLAVDNFATDQANQIDHVLQLPIQSLKIDRTVVQDIGEDKDIQRTVRAIADMAKSLEIEIVAQGVESAADVEILKSLGINLAQGFYLGKPVQPGEIEDKLAENGSRE